MKCKNCGKELKENDKYCGSCGAPVEKKPKNDEKKKINGKKFRKRWIVLILFLLVILISGGIYVSRYFFKKYKESRYADWETPMILSGIITGVTGFLSIFFIIPELVREIVQILVNPPVWILEYVMNLIK